MTCALLARVQLSPSGLLYTNWRDPGEEPKLYLFGQLKRITKQWLDTCLVCKGETYPALLMYQELADMACNRITAAITRQFLGERPMKALLDPYNPTGSTATSDFNTSRTDRWDTSGPPQNHVNWVVLDSDWEANSAASPNHIQGDPHTPRTITSGLEVPYRYGSETRSICPTLSCWWMTATATMTRLHLIVEIKGTAAKMRRKRNPQWTPTGCQA